MVTPATPRRTTSAAGLPDDPTKAKVTEVTTKTSEYIAENPDAANKDQAKANAANDKGNNQIPANRPAVFPPQRESLPQDRLSAMFAEIRDSQDFEDEEFAAVLVRQPDHMDDRFLNPCSSPQYFAQFMFRASDQVTFIPRIQKANGNSGGRFNIRVTDAQGEDLEIGLNGFVIANPVQETTSGAATGGGEFAQLIEIMREDRTQQNNNLQQLIAAMNKPKEEDEFTVMVRDKMRQDFLNPPEKKSSFDPQEFASKILESQVMMQSITQMLTNTMQNASGGGGREQDKGIILSLLSNEKVMEIIGNTVENVTNIIGDITLAKAGADSLGGNAAPNPADQSQPAQQQPQSQQPTPEQIEAAQNSMKELSSRIVDELLGDNALDDDNETMNGLAEKYPQFLQLIRMSCKGNDFATVHKQLQEFLPDQFASVPDDKREHLEARLNEFYTYMRAS